MRKKEPGPYDVYRMELRDDGSIWIGARQVKEYDLVHLSGEPNATQIERNALGEIGYRFTEWLTGRSRFAPLRNLASVRSKARFARGT